MTSEAKRGEIRAVRLCWLVFLFILTNFLSLNPPSCQTLDDVLRHYQTGQLDETNRTLLSQLQEDASNPEVLFFLSRVEEEGDLSREYLENINRRFPEWKGSVQVRLLICKYEFCKGMNVATLELTRGFKNNFSEDKSMPEILWISGCSFLALNQPDSALLRFQEILRLYPDSDWAGWAVLGIGDCFFAGENYDQAAFEYHRIIDDYRYSEAFPFAISGLANCFSQLADPEMAFLYYNLLKEKYPLSLEPVKNPAEGLSQFSGSRDETKAERLAGIRYTIQLGVFGDKENALKLRSQFEKQGYSVVIQSKVIQGKSYSLVQLGAFISYEEALQLKKKLESQTNESYRIVIK